MCRDKGLAHQIYGAQLRTLRPSRRLCGDQIFEDTVIRTCVTLVCPSPSGLIEGQGTDSGYQRYERGSLLTYMMIYHALGMEGIACSGLTAYHCERRAGSSTILLSKKELYVQRSDGSWYLLV